MWYNLDLCKREHAYHLKSADAECAYTTLEHADGNIEISCHGFKSGLIVRNVGMNIVEKKRDQPAHLMIRIRIKDACPNDFPDLKCCKTTYLLGGTQFNLVDKAYANDVIDRVFQDQDDCGLKSYLLTMFDDWDGLNQLVVNHQVTGIPVCTSTRSIASPYSTSWCKNRLSAVRRMLKCCNPLAMKSLKVMEEVD